MTKYQLIPLIAAINLFMGDVHAYLSPLSTPSKKTTAREQALKGCGSGDCCSDPPSKHPTLHLCQLPIGLEFLNLQVTREQLWKGFAASLVLPSQESSKADQGLAYGGLASTLNQTFDPMLRVGQHQHTLLGEAMESLPLEFNNIDMLWVGIMRI